MRRTGACRGAVPCTAARIDRPRARPPIPPQKTSPRSAWAPPYLKIDGEFISGCLGNRTDQIVIAAVVRIAHGMGKETIAEFVSVAQLERFVRSQGVDHAQGFHVGVPAPVPELWLGRLHKSAA